MRPRLRCIALAALAAGMVTSGIVLAAEPMDCRVEEPDSVQISWESPCQTGDWLLDTELGCRMWDWHPTPDDGAAWTGACRSGAKSGRGVVQWFEHGRPIDRFEGTFVSGRRQGYGRYTWNESDWFAGSYKDDLPDGPGTAHIAGETFTGVWHHGCFATDRRVVAIGAPRKSCDAGNSAPSAALEGARPSLEVRDFARRADFSLWSTHKFPTRWRAIPWEIPLRTSKVTNPALAASSLWAMAGASRPADSAFSPAIAPNRCSARDPAVSRA